jgi:hypothetical protein
MKNLILGPGKGRFKKKKTMQRRGTSSMAGIDFSVELRPKGRWSPCG